MLSRPGTSKIILLILLPGLLLADLAHGVLLYNEINLPVSILSLTRGVVFVIATYLAIAYHKYIENHYSIYVVGLLILTVPALVISFNSPPLARPMIHAMLDDLPLVIPVGPASTYSPSRVLYYEIKELTKLMYGPLLILMYLVLLNRKLVDSRAIMKFIEYAAYFAGVSLFLMQQFHIGDLTYGKWMSGEKGFFSSQNDISLTLAIALFAAVYRMIVSPGIVRFILLAISLFGLAGLGTRTSLFSSILVTIAVILVLLYGISDTWSLSRKRRMLAFMAPIILTAGLWTLYTAYNLAIEHSSQKRKIDVVLEGDHPRQFLIDAGICHINKRDTLSNIAGEGVYFFQTGVYKCLTGKSDSVKLVEVDWMDLYGAYGIGLVFLIHLLLLYLTFRALIDFIRYRQPEMGIIFLMFGLYTAHSALAGHALTGPMPTSIIAAVGGVLLYQWSHATNINNNNALTS